MNTNESDSPNLPLRYNEAEKLCLRRFLAVYMTAAQTALDSETKIASGDESHPLFAARIAYWRNVLAGIKWLNSQVDLEQSWMLDYPLTEYEMELQKCIRHW